MNNTKQNMSQNSYIRLFHASPNAPSVDVYANGNMIANGLSYKQLTNYLSVPSGNYNIEIFPEGQKNNPVLSGQVNIPANSAFTAAAISELPDISMLLIQEIYKPRLNKDKSYVRFVHLSPNAPAVDITLPNGTKLFQDVAYKEHTDYLEVDPGNYTLQVKPTGGNQTVLTVPDLNLERGKIYSVYAVGLVGQEPSLEAVMVTDSTY
ncbi:MAG: hypothetical protein A2Y15_07850 [Clostridiales bacterium GWF2_36_10]|nr:MAG: hypothetical protein A2Y15_07850 [Clostridiales bacterium GWF2_36_10]HAN22141.1 DUF4397 domain-containing protein [Clostridiales bacterium]